ncbi:MAG: Gfo/Idh/MocA family oxidoreductase [Kiritimatiellae bacterium]|jgi:predicted dehydrogenase|nr:Gfo/Idh/MocA family oxidoreductase [Kiritimatiellia bacterium]
MKKLSRRSFIKSSTAATGGVMAAAATSHSKNLTSTKKALSFKKPGDKLRMAFIGSGGRGGANLSEFYKLGEEIVALCDIDKGRLDGSYNKVKERCSDAKRYTDFRDLLSSESDLDAVVVSTPDHMHATAAIAAMKTGHHVYVEKPLVRTIWEVRQFKKIANELGVISQMGNNGNGNSGQRRRIEVLQSGIFGRIDEVHVTSNRPIWPQAINRPADSDPVSENINWDLWLGVAKERPYKKDVYHPFKWRGWFDFGTGAMGDIACHAMSDFFRAFKLNEVLTVECVKSTQRFPETYPAATTVKTVYRSDMQAEPISVYWYDGNTSPDPSVCPKAAKVFGNLGGKTIITERAVIKNDAVCWNEEDKFNGFAKDELCQKVAESIPRVKGHHWEFAEAIRGGNKPLSHHDHSVPLTEGVLLGCIAQQAPGQLQWDAVAMKFSNSFEGNKLVNPYIRDGWSIV